MMLLHLNLATNASGFFKLCSLLINTLTSCMKNMILLIYLTIYLTQTNNTSPCPNEKLNI